ncbi:hypothetical protein Tco_1407149 [Tanacetum coccineum]
MSSDLNCSPVLGLAFELMCDAIDFAIGARLGQRKKQSISKSYTLCCKISERAQNSPYTTTGKGISCRSARLCSGSYCSKFDIDVLRTKKEAEENLAADHLSDWKITHQDKFENKEINEAFPLETLGSIALKDDSTPWFADFANYHAGNSSIKEWTSHITYNFFKDVKALFSGMIPFCLNNCADQVI